MESCFICDKPLYKDEAVRFICEKVTTLDKGLPQYWCKECFEAYLYVYTNEDE